MSIEIYRSDRDQIQGLFASLLQASAPDLEEDSGAMRFVGLAALNLAEEHSARALFEVAKVLPWLGVYRLWEEGASLEEIAQVLLDKGLVRFHSKTMLFRRLRGALAEKHSSIRRAPGLPESSRDITGEALLALLETEVRLEAFMALPLQERREAMLDDSELLGLVIEQGMEELLPAWSITRPARALEAFARFEATGFEQAPPELGGLSERSIRFEISLARHLQNHELLAPIRAALAFSPLPGERERSAQELRTFLASFSVFATDSALMELTVALIQCRHRALTHLSGAAGLAIMAPWIEYLRGSCADFGESRGLTLREATNFAHYSLHLINLFDLAVLEEGRPGEELRRALLDLEEELKEFALAGQRAGLRDGQVHLGRYEETRWRSGKPRAYLADRLARLCGAWRQEQSPGPAGGATVLQSALAKECEELIGEYSDLSELDRLQSLLNQTQFIGHHWLFELSPAAVLHLLAFALSWGQQPPSAQEEQPDLVVDLRSLGEWLTSGQAQERREILDFLLRQRALPDLLNSPALHQAHGELGLMAVEDRGKVVISLASNAQFEALLTLLAGARGDDELFEPLLKRLRSLVEASAAAPRQDRPTAPARQEKSDADIAANNKELTG